MQTTDHMDKDFILSLFLYLVPTLTWSAIMKPIQTWVG